MSAEKTNLSVYRLRRGALPQLEARFAKRIPLRDGFDGWFHLLDPSEKTPPWLIAFARYIDAVQMPDIQTSSHGALAFISRAGAEFILSFGFAWIALEDRWLESEFGRKVALNAVPPGEVTELTSEQVFARRHVARERSPQPTSFSAFGVELDRDLVSAVEGESTYPELGGSIRGSTSLRMKIPLSGLAAALDVAESLFGSKSYQKHYPAIDTLTVINSDATHAQLDDSLDADFKSGKADSNITMCAPSFRRGDADFASSFVLGRMSKNPATSAYLQYSAWKFHLQKEGILPCVVAALSTKVHMLDHHGIEFDARSIYECLGYEVSLGGEAYVLSSGLWYRADGKFTNGIDAAIGGLAASGLVLPTSKGGELEGPYNERCCKASAFTLMDKKLVHFGGKQSKFEFCDFMNVKKRMLFCAKIPSSSSDCSHLTEQCRRTLELFFSSDPDFRQRAKKVMVKHHSKVDSSWLNARPKPGEWAMCLVLIGKAVKDLPLFARCSIARLAKYCDEHGHPFYVQSV
jgi:uncharacterized protein (TIGR04141 family)